MKTIILYSFKLKILRCEIDFSIDISENYLYISSLFWKNENLHKKLIIDIDNNIKILNRILKLKK